MISTYEIHLIQGYMKRRGLAKYRHSYGDITFTDAEGRKLSVRDLTYLLNAAQREAAEWYATHSCGVLNVD